MRYKKLPVQRLFKGCSPLQPLCNLTGNPPQSATFHTATVSVHCKDKTDDRLITEFLLHKDKKGKEESSPHSGTFVFARHTKTNASQSQKSLHFSDTHRTLLISF